MKRLRDTEASSPLLQKAHALLDAAPPLPDSRERMMRVRRALEQPKARGGLLRVPAFAAAMAVALFGASAFAAVRIFEAIDRPAATPAESSAAVRAVHKGKRAGKHAKVAPVAPALPAAQAADGVAAVEAEEPAEVVPSREPAQSARALGESVAHQHRAAGHAHVRAHDAAPRSEVAEPERTAQPEPQDAVAQPEPAAAASDSELVHRAVKALRRDGDPALAARLLQEHRARNPHGPLAEEALSLQIEAAMALRSPRAAALAREYLARYPGGRYASVAARALQEAPP